jgi:hypothetical protein
LAGGVTGLWVLRLRCYVQHLTVQSAATQRLMLAVPSQDAGEALPGELLHELKAHDGPVLAVRFNRAGTYCLSAGRVRVFLHLLVHRLIPTHTGGGVSVL